MLSSKHFSVLCFCFFSFFRCAGSPLLHANFSYGTWASDCVVLYCCEAQDLGAQASVVVMHRLSCFMECGIFLDLGSNPCPLHWQADSYPLYQWSPLVFNKIKRHP